MGKWAQYGKRYCKEWEKDGKLKGWLQPVIEDTTKAACKYCKTVIRAHYNDLCNHANTSKHKHNAQPGSNVRTLFDVGVTAKPTLSNATKESHLYPLQLWSPAVMERTMQAVESSSKALHILLCCTGSVACIKVPFLISSLERRFSDCKIKVALTQSSVHFLKLAEISKTADILQDKDEWSSWTKLGDSVLHIDLCKWADVVVFAPLDANTLAKLANGLSDNLVTCVARAWDFPSKKPAIFCPAMNTKMWDHPITSQHVGTLKSWGYTEIPPISKKLACGDEGMGAMAEVETIVEYLLNILSASHN